VPPPREEHIHNDSARPNINRFTIRRLMENLRRHIEQSPTLRLHITIRAQLNLRAESKIDDLDGGEFVGIAQQNVIYRNKRSTCLI
jgi:hypothetical protein